MKKKLLDRRGAAIELAIMMMVFSIFITTIVLTTALLQNTHKAKAELGIKQDIFLEQLGEDFVDVVTNDKLTDWEPEYNDATIPQDTVVTHIWESVIVKPTCQAEGYTLHTCTLCGETKKTDVKRSGDHSVIPYGENYKYVIKDCIKTETGKCRWCNQVVSVPTSAHSWGAYVTQAPTCTANGYESRTCTNEGCGAVDTKELTALGHISIGSAETKKATCTENGIMTHTCAVCGAKYPEEIKATGHNFGEYAVNSSPTENAHGQQTRKCDICGAAQTEIAHNWVDVEPITQPTCTEKGMKNQLCTVPDCGAIREVEIEATEHNFDSADICTVCGINKE